MRKNIFSMIVISLAGISVLATALITFISMHKFENAFNAALNDRYVFILHDVRAALEAEMGVGLDLENLTHATQVLNEAMGRDNAVVSVEVFARSGHTIFSTDSSFVGDIVPKHWEAAAAQSTGQPWVVKEPGIVVLGIELKDMLSNPTGGLVLRYGTDRHTAHINTLEKQIMQRAGILWLITFVCVIAFVAVMTRPIQRHFASLEGLLRSLTTATPEGSQENSEEHPPVADVQAENVQAFADAYRDAETRINRLESDLRKIDEET